MTKRTYEFDFSYDNGKWYLDDAHIGDGVLHIDTPYGYGERDPNDNWNSGAYDNFEIEIDVKNDSIDEGVTVYWIIYVSLPNPIYFRFNGSINKIEIEYPFGTIQASQSENIKDTNWHTVKIRRIGTIYYFSVDGGNEISYDYGTPSPLYNIGLCYYFYDPIEDKPTGSYDNFKYSWWLEEDYAFIM